MNSLRVRHHPHRATVGNSAKHFPYFTKRDHDAARRLASQAVKTAISRGELVRQFCERCPKPKRGPRAMGEAHHDDYAKPLEVRWLCRTHHRQRHAEIAALLPTPEFFHDVRQRENDAVLMACPSTASLVRDVTAHLLAEMDRRGVGMAELARRLGVSRQQVSLYFNGGIRTVKALATIANAIGCDAAFVITDRQNSEVA